MLSTMRKTRLIEHCRCYHLVSRLAHRAFFLDDEEKTRAVELLRRVEEFSGVIVLAYAIMSNHFHIFIYVPEPEDIGDDEILRRINALYREASLAQVLGEWTRLKDEEAKLLEYSRPTGKYVSRSGITAGRFSGGCGTRRSSFARTSSISRCLSTLGATIMARCSSDVTTNATTSQRSR